MHANINPLEKETTKKHKGYKSSAKIQRKEKRKKKEKPKRYINFGSWCLVFQENTHTHILFTCSSFLLLSNAYIYRCESFKAVCACK